MSLINIKFYTNQTNNKYMTKKLTSNGNISCSLSHCVIWDWIKQPHNESTVKCFTFCECSAHNLKQLLS